MYKKTGESTATLEGHCEDFSANGARKDQTADRCASRIMCIDTYPDRPVFLYPCTNQRKKIEIRD
jgi:hypothetical protein